MDSVKSFSELKIEDQYIEKLASHEITEPSAVQTQAIPEILAGTSLLFQSETGTGKTLAYLLPLLQNIEKIENSKKEVKIVIVSPTIELASQIKLQVQLVSDSKAALLVGGAPIKRQIELLKEKPLVVIGGPARLLELFHLKKLKLDGAAAVVLDEVDRLISPELRDQTIELICSMKKDIQLIAASATITASTQKILQSTRIKQNGTTESDLKTLFLPPEDVLRKRITHYALFAETRDKIDTLRSLLNAEKPAKALIFTSKIDQVANIVSKLKYKNIECYALTAKTEKAERKATIDRFRSGKIKILVTSDLVARGMDIPNISHVIQMDMPSDDDFFIHRAGRTARMGKTGINIVIGDGYEMRKYAAIEKKLKITVYPRMLYKGRLVDPNELNAPKEESSSQS
ncbi:MAG: DEAD/DEAH box helicase [Treponema sp.]|uniref:DEAD/DEAH box helicase n=1 Tax=Treponema sp. TaxID=166 RepID=UPI002A91D3AD|nr:DEAD/DEAH box helicase [Treponema sp.]MDY6398498.1 DEAD/DEAH box helicase [Treponema sp.]